MTQIDLDLAPAREQERQLDRVRDKLDGKVLAFCAERLRAGGRFFLSELEAAVGGTPGSGGRVLRVLRAAGSVAYEVVNRARSEYQVLEVHP